MIIVAALFGAVAVALGAFGAHALANTFDASAKTTWQTAVDYQFRHALALLGVGLLAYRRAARSLDVAAWTFVIGIVLFSSSLYALAFGAPRVVGIVTPFGGAALIVGWLALAWSAWRSSNNSGPIDQER